MKHLLGITLISAMLLLYFLQRHVTLTRMEPKLELLLDSAQRARIELDTAKQLGTPSRYSEDDVASKEREYTEFRNRAMLVSEEGYWSLIAGIGVLVLGLAAGPSIMSRGKSASQSTSSPGVFISYNHHDLELAQLIRDQLAGRGLRAILIEMLLDVKDDRDLGRVLKETMLDARCAVVILTRNSLSSRWVRFERTVADSKLHTLIYLYQDMSLLRATWETAFLPPGNSFRPVKLLSAERLFLRYDPTDQRWQQAAATFAAKAERVASSALAGRQFLMSFSSLDLMLFNFLRSIVEVRCALQPESVWRRTSVRLVRALHFCVIIGVMLTVLCLLIAASVGVLDRLRE